MSIVEEPFKRLDAGCCGGKGDTPATPTQSTLTPSGREQKQATCVQRCFSSFHVSLIGAHCFLTFINAAFLFTHVSLKKIEADRFNNATRNNATSADYLTKEPNTQIITAGLLLLINIITLISLIIPFCVSNRTLTKFAVGWCVALFAGSVISFIFLRNSLDVYTSDTLLLSTAFLAVIEGISMFLKYFYQGCCSDTPSADGIPSSV